MKDFKIGVIVDSFKKGFVEGVALAKSLGVNGIQMYMVSGEMAPENMTPEKIREVRKVLDDNCIEIAAVCADLGGHGFSIASDNPAKIERSKLIMNVAKELGANILTTHIGVVPEDKTNHRYAIMQDACRELGAYAHEHGMCFAIETGPETAPVLREFLDSLDCGGIKVNLDPANFVMVTGQDPVEAVLLLKDYIVHTHAKDGKMLRNVGPERVYNHFADGGIEDSNLGECFIETPLGEGQVDFPAYLDALRKIGFSGYLTIEREVGDDPYTDIKKAVDLLNNI